MRHVVLVLATLLVLLIPRSSFAETMSAKTFYRQAQLSNLSMSPSGRLVSMLRYSDSAWHLVVVDRRTLEFKRILYLNRGWDIDYEWVGDRTLFIQARSAETGREETLAARVLIKKDGIKTVYERVRPGLLVDLLT